MKQFRQGDIYFEEVESIPEDAKVQTDGIIARGEVTGHTHRVQNPSMGAIMMAASVMYLNAIKTMSIVHEEHNTIDLPPGNWQVLRQREWTPEGWRQVAD